MCGLTAGESATTEIAMSSSLAPPGTQGPLEASSEPPCAAAV